MTIHFGQTGFVVFLTLFMHASELFSADVLTQRNDHFRSSLNPAETNLTPATVKLPGSFHKLYTRLLDADCYAQPLYVSGLEIAGKPRDVIFVATENNTVCAFEDDPHEKNPGQAPLWQRNLGPSIPTEELSVDIGDPPSGWTDLTTIVGITGTPVIDRAKNLLFVVSKTKVDGQYANTLYALDIRSGEIVRKTVVEGSAAGNGIGSKDGRIVFQAVFQINRPALLLDHGRLYVAFGGQGDVGLVHGWVFAYDPADLKVLDVFITTPNTVGKNNGQGALWMSGTGPAADEDGNIYISVANGGNDPQSGDFGDSFVKLRFQNDKFSVAGWFTPTNEAILKLQDADFGSAGPLLVPGTQLASTASKEGRLYLLDRSAMKGATPALQDFQVTPGPYYFGPATDYGAIRYWNIHGTPVQFQSGHDRFFYICGEEEPIRAYRLATDTADGKPRLEPESSFATSDERAAYPPERAHLANPPVANPYVWMPGGFLTISCDGTRPNSAILWALMPLDGNANGRVVHGVLRAFDPVNFVVRGDGSLRIPQLWSSDHDQNHSEDSLGMYPKFSTPTVAHGHVMVTTFREEGVGTNGIHAVKKDGLPATLTVYGLPPSS